MIKNRTVQLIYQTIYCTLGIVGTVASTGIFDDVKNIRWDFYVHFTNLSNYFCLAIMLVLLVNTARKKEDGYVDAIPTLKFIGIVSILITFVVFNVMIAGAEGRAPQLNWRVGSILFHLALPMMYILNWVLFYERKKVRWFYPLASISFPFAYMVFILIQMVVLRFDTSILIPGTSTPLIYPYFFMNIEKLGVDGFVLWMFMFLVAVLAVGYFFLGIDVLIAKIKTRINSAAE